MYIARRAYWEGYTKALFKKTYRDSSINEKILSAEYQLLRRILIKLLPGILKTLFTNPVIAWRKLSVTINALFCVALGYFSYALPSLLGLRKAKDYGIEET